MIQQKLRTREQGPLHMTQGSLPAVLAIVQVRAGSSQLFLFRRPAQNN